MSQNLFAGRIEPVQLEEEIQRSYLDYAMSVIVGRALPDVRDGLKPVHRRILWSMFEQGLRPDRPYRKSANVVGGVMSKYHPHGDTAIYDALVRMAQDFSLRYPLGRPARELRLGRRRPGRCVALHRGAPRLVRDGDAARHRGRDRGPRAELRRLRAGAARAAQSVPEPAGQRRRRHRGRHGHEHPAAQPRRGDRRGGAHDRSPGRDGRGPHEVREGAGFPDGRLDHRQAGHQGRVRDRPRLDQGPRRHDDRRGLGGAFEHRRDRAALPGEQGPAGREDRRAREDRTHQGDRRRPGPLERPCGHAPRDRAEARGEPARRVEPALQAHAAAGQLRRDHARPRRQRAAHAEPRRDDRLLRRPPGGRRHAPHEVREAQGGGARPHRPGPADRARPPRPGDQDHPGLAGRRGSADEADVDVQAQRDPGEPHPGHAAAAPHEAGARGAREGAQRPPGADPLPELAAEGPEEAPRRDQGGAGRDPEEARGRASLADQGGRGRVRHRGPDRRGGRGDHGLACRLRQACADRHVPPAGAGRQGHQGRDAEGRGRHRERLHDHDAPLAACSSPRRGRSTG